MSEIEVLDENKDFLVVNKAPGLSIHSESGPGLISQLQEQSGIKQLFTLHRLDAVTSGLLLVAKNRTAAAELSRLFADRKIEKIYLALLDKKPKKSQGSVVGDMLKARGGSWKLARTRENPAITWFFTYSYAPNRRVVIVKPLSGKTHQIRVALKSLAAPIIGDERYGGVDSARTCLHAWQLRFIWKGEERVFIAPLSNESSESATEFSRAELHSFLEGFASPFDLAWPRGVNK